MIKIDDDMNIEKSKNDIGYFKLFVKHYCEPSSSDNCIMTLFNSDKKEILKINSFDYDKEGYFFKIVNSIDEGKYSFSIILETSNHFLKIVENRGFIVK